MRKLAWNLFKLLVFAFIIYGIYTYFVPETEVHTVDLDAKEEVLHHTTAELTELVVTESRNNRELIVYEEDFSASQEISKTVFNWDIFRKSQTVTSYGTALYTVDLSAVTAESISYEEASNVLTIQVPHSCLKTVTVDVEKTEFSDVSRKIFGWGDLTLTPEQQNVIQQDLQANLEELARRPDALARADQSAVTALTQLYQNALNPVDSSIVIHIVFAE